MQVGDRRHDDAEHLERLLLEPEAAPTRIEQIRANHRVEAETLDPDAVPRQHHHVVLGVVPDLPDCRIGQCGPQGIEHLGEWNLPISLCPIRGLRVADGNIERLALAQRKRKPDDIRQQFIGRVGLQVKGEDIRRGKTPREHRKCLRRIDDKRVSARVRGIAQ